MNTTPTGLVKGIDTTDDLEYSIAGLKGAEIRLVLKYTNTTSRYPNKAFSRAELKALQNNGIRTGYLYEAQDDISMFGPGKSVGIAASILNTFERDKRKPGTTCYVCADFEVSTEESHAVIGRTMSEIQPILKAQGFLLGVYGEGYLCGLLKAWGIVHSDYVSESTSFPGTATYTGWDLKQFVGAAPLGIDADNLEVRESLLQSLFPDPIGVD